MYLPVYPQPREMVETGGRCVLPARGVLYVSKGSMTPGRMAELIGLWHRASCTALTLTIEEKAALAPHSCVLGEADAALWEGDLYALRVTEKGFAAAARDDLGLLYALYTALQLIYPVCLDAGREEIAMDACEIHDAPALKERMLHVCVFPETTLYDLEKTIRMAAFVKMTHLVLEFWGTIRLDSFPELAWKEHAFSKEEVKPLIRLARDLGLEVMPMFNHLGHATQSRGAIGRHTVLDQYPRLALLFEPDGWTWCLSNPRVHALLHGVREELMELCGPGAYFHLGCDEAYSFASCPLCRAKDRTALLSDYLNGIEAELEKQGRRGIIWGDALLDSTAWERPAIATSRPDQQTHLALDQLSRGLVIADWQYNLRDTPMETAAFFREKGFDVLAAPWDGPGNIAHLAREAERLALPGIMVTTWHHLNPMVRNLHVSAGQCWRGSAHMDNPGQWVHSAALLRKVMPPTDEFEKFGFLPDEIDRFYTRNMG